MCAVQSAVLPAGLGAAAERRGRKRGAGTEFGLRAPDPRAFQPGHLHRRGAHRALQLHQAAPLRKGPGGGRELAFAARIGDRHLDRLAATPLRRAPGRRQGGLGHGRSPAFDGFYGFYGFYDWRCGKSGGVQQFRGNTDSLQSVFDFHGFHGFHGFHDGRVGSGGGRAVRVLSAAFPRGNPCRTAGRPDFSPSHRVDVENNRDSL